MSQQELLLRPNDLREVEALRQRLEEAEDTLRAIRGGQVDSVVVSGARGEQIFVLKSAEQPYRIFLETMNEGAATLLANGTIAYSNRCFAEMVKTPLERVIGATLETFVRQDDRQRLDYLVERAIQGPVKDVFQLDSGTEPALQAQFSLCTTKLEGAAAICLIASDVTQRVEAGRLRSYLAAIVESSDDAIVGKKLDGTILSWNHGAEELYGYSVDEVIGRPISMLLPADRSQEETGLLERIKRGERVAHYETARVRKNGDLVPVLVSVSPVFDAEGTVIGASSIAHDTTEIKRAEAALTRSSAYNRSLIDASLDPIITIAPDGKITDANHAAEALTERNRQQLIGTDFCGYFTDPERARQGYQRVFSEGTIRDYELEIRDGRTTPVLCNASTFPDENGNVAGVVAAARDITQQRLAEQKIRDLNSGLECRVAERTAELLSANKEVETFSYSVSHDLRAPLRAMDGFSKALLEDYSDKLDAVGIGYLQHVRAASQRMDHQIEGLLTLSRSTRCEIHRTRVDLSSLAQTIAIGLQKTNPERQVEFVIAPGMVTNADPALLRTVLENLLGNALKFSGKHLQARIEVGAGLDGGETAFFVRDDGAGFDMAYAQKLFGPFQRLHTPEEFEGTGIGLASAQRIIHRHGGRIWAHGEPEKGATFFFTLPQKTEASA